MIRKVTKGKSTTLLFLIWNVQLISYLSEYNIIYACIVLFLDGFFELNNNTDQLLGISMYSTGNSFAVRFYVSHKCMYNMYTQCVI